MKARSRNRTARRVLPLLAGATALIASPASPALADTPDNAALLYLRYATLQQSELASGQEEVALIDWAEDPVLRARLEINVSITEGFIRATKIERCDFGVEDDTLFFTASMPHLAQLRSAARLLAADARRLTEEDPVAAAERVAALVRMGNHAAAGDQLLIAALVGQAIAELAFSEIERLDEHGALTPTAARLISDALDDLPKHDPWRLADAILAERDLAVAMARKHVDLMKRGERDKASALTHGMPGVHVALARHTAATLEAELNQMTTYYDALIRLWEMPGKINRYDTLGAAVANGEFGALASIVTPAMWNIEAARLRGDRALVQARATVSAALEGTP